MDMGDYMKKINLFLIGLGLGLTLFYDIGITLIIPVIMYYGRKELKNLIYLIPSILISVTLTNLEQLLFAATHLLLMILAIIFIQSFKKIKKHSIIFYSLMLVIITIFSFIVFFENIQINNLIIFTLISLAVFLFLCFEDYIYLNNIIKAPTLYAEHIIVIIAVLGFSKQLLFNVSLGIIAATYFGLFYAKKYRNIYSLILLVILFLIEYLGFNHEESVLLLFICTLYFLDYNYLFFVSNLILIILSFTSTWFKESYIYSLMITSIIFEVVWLIFNKKQTISKMNVEYLNAVLSNTITFEYSVFSSFLDFFVDTFKSKKVYSEQMSKALNCIKERHCNQCNKQNECYKENKVSVVYDIKHLIEKKEVSNKFLKYCPCIQSIKQTSEMLSNQMIKEKDTSNIILLAVLNETKQVLDKYQQDIESKELIKNKIIEKFHNKLYESTFNIKEINYKRLFVDDYYIEVVAVKKDLINEKELLTLINNSLDLELQITLKNEPSEFRYIITPKQRIHIKYGYGNLSSSQMELCGDNHLIKNYQNGHFLAAISDGMGNGFMAFEDSRRVLEALDSLCYCSTSISTNVEILNLLYILQGYTERYSTLDAVDINRCTMMANFYKLGATTSYIFHDDNTFTKLENSSLPLGIEEEILQTQITLRNNDLILLTSDGIFENVVNEQELLNLIKNLKSEIPQKIAYAILEYTLNSKVKVKDDMSIIILKIETIK